MARHLNGPLEHVEGVIRTLPLLVLPCETLVVQAKAELSNFGVYCHCANQLAGL